MSSAADNKQLLKQMQILAIAMSAGVFLFILVAVILNQLNGPLMPEMLEHKKTLTIVVAISSFITLLIAKQTWTKAIQAAKISLNPLSDKLNQYRTALVKYLALCEVPALAGIILFLFTGEFIFIAIAAVMVGYMLANLPAKKKVIENLELDLMQQKELE
jgi:hypothetical protein